MVQPRKVLGKAIEGPHIGADTVTGIVTFPFGIRHSVRSRYLMIHFMATYRVHFIVLRRLQANEVQLQ